MGARHAGAIDHPEGFPGLRSSIAVMQTLAQIGVIRGHRRYAAHSPAKRQHQNSRGRGQSPRKSDSECRPRPGKRWRDQQVCVQDPAGQYDCGYSPQDARVPLGPAGSTWEASR
jgi:hypothetical protein